MAGVGAAEPVHGLGVVAHAGQPGSVGPQQPDDVGLDRVHVLVLVDEHGVEHAAQGRTGAVVGQRGAPQQQQVVEVDKPVAALARDVPAEHLGQLAGEVGAPRVAVPHHLGDGAAGVHAPGVDVGAGAGPRGAPSGLGQPVVGPQRVEQVGHVAGVDDGELRRQRERLGVLPDDPVRDGVEGTAGDPLGAAVTVRACPGQHLLRRPAGEGEQQDAARLQPLRAQPRRPGGQRPGLAGPGPGQHEQRAARMGRGPPLLVVEAVKQRRGFEHEDECSQRCRQWRPAGARPAPGCRPGRTLPGVRREPRPPSGARRITLAHARPMRQVYLGTPAIPGFTATDARASGLHTGLGAAW